MKNWLIQKEEEQKKLFPELMEMTIKTLQEFNEQEKTEVIIRVIFDKEEWLNGKAVLKLLEKNDEDYNVKGQYNHSIYNSNQDISKKSPLFKLMEKGLFTNTWFSILDNSRVYDTTILLANDGYILENENCEYLENKHKENHFGFNITQSQSKKNKLK